MKLIYAALSLSMLIGCTEPAADPPGSPATPESPDAAINAIIALYEEGDFDSLIRKRYAEIAKAADEAQIQQLVDRFTAQFQDPAARASATETYRSALGTEPEFSEDGTVATYQLGERFIKLSRMPDGLWGFHL